MPAKLVNRATGERELIDDSDLPAALSSGKYLAPDAVAVHRFGQDTYVSPDVAQHEQAFSPIIDPARTALAQGHAMRERDNAGVGATLEAGLGGAVSGLSFGLVDPFQDAQEFHPIAAGVGQAAGAIAPAFAGDLGGLAGLGRGAVVADDALTAERAASSLSSRLLYGGERTAGAGMVEQGLTRANAALRDATAGSGAADAAAAAGLHGLDAKGLRAAHASELEAIETGRVPQRGQLADDLATYRQDLKDQKLWLSTTKSTAAPREFPAGFDLSLTPEGAAEPVFNGQPELKSGVPKYRDLDRATYRDVAYVVRPSELADGKLYGIDTGIKTTAGAAVDERTVAVRNAWAADQDVPAIEIDVAKDGKRFIADGNHRIWAAIADGDRPVAVRFRPIEGDVSGMEPVGEHMREALGPEITGARETREIGKTSLEADKALDRVLRNPKALADNPKRALAALQQQEHALERLTKQSTKLKATFAADTSGTRLAALDKVPAALERNRALQARIAELTAAPSSARLSAISDAKDLLAEGTPPKSMAEQMLGGAVFSGVAGFAHALPGVGSMLAPLAGAKASKFVTDLVFGRIGKTTAELAGRASDIATRFLDVGKRAGATPQAVVLASQVLSHVAFAQAKDGNGPASPPASKPKAGSPDLATLYQKRTSEIRSQTMYDPMGKPVMRPEARIAMASRLDAVRAISPMLADRMETIGARRIEYLASIIPRLPDFGTVQIGPDRRQVPDLAMRSWARSAAVVEDPHAALERMQHGAFTPEDAMALRAVYPELVADVTNRITQQLPTLREKLPFNRRLALSMLTGVPVDPAMTPGVLRVLQGMFAAEPGTAGGTQAPVPQPQFGSVKRSDPGTPAQRRAGLI